MEHALDLLSQAPDIQKLDVVAEKLPQHVTQNSAVGELDPRAASF